MLDKIASTIRTCEVPKVIKINNIKYHQYSFCLPTLESGVNVGLRLFLFGFFTTANKKSTYLHTWYTLEKKYLHLNQIVIIHPTCSYDSFLIHFPVSIIKLNLIKRCAKFCSYQDYGLVTHFSTCAYIVFAFRYLWKLARSFF